MTSGGQGLAKPKPSKLAAGIAVAASSLLLLIAAIFCRGWPYLHVDFPCEWFGYPATLSNAHTRIAYCISYWPRNAVSGGAVYAYGSTDQDRILADSLGRPIWHSRLVFERQADILVFNGQRLAPGQTTSVARWFPSLNPWLLVTTHLSVTNEGRRQIQGASSDTIYVSGDMKEGWLPNPLGIVVLAIGLSLLVRGANDRRAARPGN